MNYSSYAKKLAEVFSDPDTGERFRKHIYRSLVESRAGLVKLRKHITAAGVPVETKTEVDRMIDDYDGSDGLLVLFMGEEELHERASKTGKDEGQIDLEDDIAREERERRKAAAEAEEDDDLPSVGLVIETVSTFRKREQDIPLITMVTDDDITKAINGLKRRSLLAINGYFLAYDMTRGQPAQEQLQQPDELGKVYDALAEVANGGKVEAVRDTEPTDESLAEMAKTAEDDWSGLTLRTSNEPVEPIVGHVRTDT